MPDTLLVVAKRPIPGQTKTRLCPPLTARQAADLYECFLRDTLEIMRRVPGVQRAISYLPEDAGGYFQRLAPDMTLTPQCGETLGERLDHLLTVALAGGAERAVVMDSDSPTLPVEHIRRAFAQLAEADVVLGPARDGGYYLIGMKVPHSHLLQGVQMSTPHVLTDTLTLAANTGVTVSLLPAWYDVDTLADLDQLRSEVAEATDGIAAFTRRWLSQALRREGAA
jgi:hypothetical protein